MSGWSKFDSLTKAETYVHILLLLSKKAIASNVMKEIKKIKAIVKVGARTNYNNQQCNENGNSSSRGIPPVTRLKCYPQNRRIYNQQVHNVK